MKTSELRTKLSDIYRKYVDAYRVISDQDYKAYLQTLKPGTVTPPKYKFFNDTYRNQFEESANECKNEARAIITDALNRIRAKKTESPSTEAVNYLSLLKDKADLSESDIDDALETYGGNYSAYNAIKALADSHHIRTITSTELDRLEADLRNYILPTFEHFGIIDAENGHATDGARAMFESITLAELPELTF